MYSFKPIGDKGVLINFEQKISPEISLKIRRFTAKQAQRPNGAVIEIIPAYASICVVYNPVIAEYGEIVKYCRELLEEKSESQEGGSIVYEIPVLYNDQTGPDINFVAEHNNLSVDEVIAIHTSKPYLIYMLGFAPGFCYLGGMDERIAAPRQQVPRQKIKPGTVGIAGSQTGMYPIESPGGWQLIGVTPLKLYDPKRNPPVYYKSGDYIKYKAIDEAEFNLIAKKQQAGEYRWVSRPYEGDENIG